MASVVIVSGCPGAGKTTLARALAAAEDRGVHFVTDTFYEFIPNVIDPATPASRHQNTVVMNAVARAARAFADGEYTTFVDGVVGPWFLWAFREVLESGPSTHYVVLQASEPAALARVRGRQGPGLSGTVRAMVTQFADLGVFARHGVATDGRSEEDVRSGVEVGLARGDFALDWSLVSRPE